MMSSYGLHKMSFFFFCMTGITVKYLYRFYILSEVWLIHALVEYVTDFVIHKTLIALLPPSSRLIVNTSLHL